jgi:hypothetical protein
MHENNSTAAADSEQIDHTGLSALFFLCLKRSVLPLKSPLLCPVSGKITDRDYKNQYER